MKTTTFKSLLITFPLFLIISQAYAQNLVGTRIDVMGSRYSDQLWIFSVPTCNRVFDNGWDVSKVFGNTLAPQLFAMEPDGYYQVDAIPDMNNTYLGFKSGEDTFYTFTFTHENLSDAYQHLYLIDSVANKTIDIFQTGTTYSFTAPFTNAPVRRFKIVTSLPAVVMPTVPADSITVPPVTPPVVIPVVVTPVVTTPDFTPRNVDITDINYSSHHDWVTKLTIHSFGKAIYIENPGKEKGKMELISAVTGKVLETLDFNADGTTIVQANVAIGTYVVNGTTPSEKTTVLIIIR